MKSIPWPFILSMSKGERRIVTQPLKEEGKGEGEKGYFVILTQSVRRSTVPSGLTLP